jgi:dTDP-4-dehydrorhamnose reductase
MVPESRNLRVLLFGASGQVGHELQRDLASFGSIHAPGRDSADLSKPETIRPLLRGLRPQVIVNAAAYTAVDKAESEPELAEAVNANAPGVLAEEAEALDACLVHYSTDYVFDGEKSAPYTEGDPPSPRSSYGRSKLAGEQAVRARCRKHLILRVSWVFGAHGANFLKTMLRLASERETLRVVADQVGAPTDSELIARVTAELLAALTGSPAGDQRWGSYNLAAAGATTWCEYAKYAIGLARDSGMALKAGPDDVFAIRTEDYPVKAVRPKNSRLDTGKIRSTFAVALPDWRSGVDRVMDELVRASS